MAAWSRGSTLPGSSFFASPDAQSDWFGHPWQPAACNAATATERPSHGSHTLQRTEAPAGRQAGTAAGSTRKHSARRAQTSAQPDRRALRPAVRQAGAQSHRHSPHLPRRLRRHPDAPFVGILRDVLSRRRAHPRLLRQTGHPCASGQRRELRTRAGSATGWAGESCGVHP